MTRQDILEKEPKYLDYAGFTYDGIHSSQLGLYKVSSGNRYTQDLSPAFADQTAQVAGSDGTLIFGSNITKRDFNIDIAYDNLNESAFHFMERLFAKKKLVPLIFDEIPYKVYWVKPSAPPQLKYICFNQGHNKERIYKGEGTLKFVCYEGFGRSNILSQNQMLFSDYISGSYTVRLARNSKIKCDWLARVLKDKYGAEVPYYDETAIFNSERPDHISLQDCKCNIDLYGRDNSYLPSESAGPISPYDSDVPIDTWITKNPITKSIMICYGNARTGFPTQKDKAWMEQRKFDLSKGQTIVKNYREEADVEQQSIDTQEHGQWGQNPQQIDLSALKLVDGQLPTENIAEINPNIQTFYNFKTNQFELMATYLGPFVELNSKTGEIQSFDANGQVSFLVKNNGQAARVNVIVDGTMEPGASSDQIEFSDMYHNYYEWKDAINLPEFDPILKETKKGYKTTIDNIGDYDTPINFYLRKEDIADSNLVITTQNEEGRERKLRIDLDELVSKAEDFSEIYINSEFRVIQLINENGEVIDTPVYNKYIKEGDFVLLHQFETLKVTTNMPLKIDFQYRYV